MREIPYHVDTFLFSDLPSQFMQFTTSFCKIVFDKTGVLNDFNLFPFDQWPKYFTMQVNKCRHINRLVPMVTRDGQPKATLVGCLFIANLINATLLCKTLCQFVKQKTF